MAVGGSDRALALLLRRPIRDPLTMQFAYMKGAVIQGTHRTVLSPPEAPSPPR
jgi:hypothetical protein